MPVLLQVAVVAKQSAAQVCRPGKQANAASSVARIARRGYRAGPDRARFLSVTADAKGSARHTPYTCLSRPISAIHSGGARGFESAVHETPRYMDYDTLVDMHLVTRQGFGDRPLFGTKRGGEWEWMTYKEFGHEVDKCRAALCSIGIQKGDKVGIVSNNRVEWAICAYAACSLGAAYVPMYEEQRPKDWQYIIEDAGCKALFVSNEKIYHQTFHFGGVLGGLKEVYCFEAPPDQDHSFQAFLNRTPPSVPAVIPHPDDLACLIYTSGTTGKPKGVMLSHRNLLSNITGLRVVLPQDLISCFDRSLSFLPWAHCYGQNLELHAFMAHGAALGLAEGIEKLGDNMMAVKPTVLFAVPTLFKKVYDGIHAKVAEGSPIKQYLFKKGIQVSHRRRLHQEQGKMVGLGLRLQHKVLDKLVLSKIRDRFGGQLKVSFVGGAATPLEVLAFFENVGVKLCEGYGLTETSPLVTVNSPDPANRKLGTTGRVLGGVTVKILMDGKETPLGEEGEVCVAGPNVMQGYNNDPKATAEVFTVHEGVTYFRTGDLGRMEDGVYLKITGRIKEQYKLENGKYVVPGPIEAALTSSKYITQALLFGDNKPFNVVLLVPDWDALKAWAAEKTDLGPNPEKAALAAHTTVRHLIEGEVQGKLQGFKKYEIPRKWELLEEGFTKERGMLTPKLSVKRHMVIKTYQEFLAHMYGEQLPELRIEEEPVQAVA